MSINFAALQGLTIPEGVVTEIKDASGRVLWSALPTDRAVLIVAKQTITTYAGETEYPDEQFILLDIYPRKGGKVNVTYGGLTKTITDTSGAEEPNAQQVFFGTFNGVSDSTATPDSGTLTIEGDFAAYGIGSFTNNKSVPVYCSCVTGIIEWGEKITYIPNDAFYSCESMDISFIPKNITKIGDNAFWGWYNLKLSDNFFSHGLTSIGKNAFLAKTPADTTEAGKIVNSIDITIPASVTSIGVDAFAGAVIDAYNSVYVNRVTVLATTPPGYGDATYSSIFGNGNGSSEFSIIVPKGCGEAYKAANGWSEYADNITEAS